VLVDCCFSGTGCPTLSWINGHWIVVDYKICIFKRITLVIIISVVLLLRWVCSNGISDSWRGVMFWLRGSLHLHSFDVELALVVVLDRLNSCNLNRRVPTWLHLPPSLWYNTILWWILTNADFYSVLGKSKSRLGLDSIRYFLQFDLRREIRQTNLSQFSVNCSVSAAVARNAATRKCRSSWLTDSNTFYQTNTLASLIRNFVLDFLKLKLPWLSKYWLSGLTVLTTNLGLGFDWDSEFWDWDLLVRFGIGI